MKKKTTKRFLLTMILALSMFLVACGEKAKDEITVTFYETDGTTVLKTEKVAKDGTVNAYTPEKEGYEFVGWFATPQMQHEFDFTTKLTQDTSIFAGFIQFQQDTREFAIVGNGTSPVMLSSNWGGVINDEHKLKKSESVNEYTITLDLYEGDEFQLAINSSWHNQRGCGYMEETSKDGVDYFVNSGGLGDISAKRSNIKVATTGNYTLTLTTNPAEDVYETDNANYTEENKEVYNYNAFDKITWIYNGELDQAPAEMETKYYIKGSGITNWSDKYTEVTGFKMEDNVHTLTVALKEGEEFLFSTTVTIGGTTSVGTEYVRFSNLDETSAALFDKTESYNLIAKENGTYTFTYDPATTVLSAEVDTDKFIEQYDYYMKGSYGGTEWGTEGNEQYQLKETEKGSYIYVLTDFAVEAGDEMGLQSMMDGERVLFINYDYLAPASDDNANGDFVPHSGGGGNIVANEAGTYTVTYNAYTSEMIFTK